MPLLQKFYDCRSQSVSPKFRFTHQSTTAYSQFSENEHKLSPVPIFRAKHVCHHSELSSVKFRYLHKFDWQKLEKKFQIIQRIQRNTQKGDKSSESNINLRNRVKASSVDVHFQLLKPYQIKIRNHSVAFSHKSTFVTSSNQASPKQKLAYRLNEHKKFITEFGVNENEKQRLCKVKKNRETLFKKPIKRIINYHKPDYYLQ